MPRVAFAIDASLLAVTGPLGPLPGPPPPCPLGV